MDLHYEIIPLPKDKWKGTLVPIRYTTDAYYDLELTEGETAFTAQMVKSALICRSRIRRRNTITRTGSIRITGKRPRPTGSSGKTGRCWPVSKSARRSGQTDSW